MSTTVRYGQVTMENVVTRQFEQSCQYDDTQTDLLYHRFTIRVEGVVHSQGLASAALGWHKGQAGSNAGEHAAPVMQALRDNLLTPRQLFTYAIAGVNLLTVGPSPGPVRGPNYDVNNGPKPQNVSIQHVAGSKVFRVSFTIELCIVECTGDGGGQTGVLNNRWSIEDSQDDNFFTTRVIRGRLRVAAGYSANAFRGLVVPALEDGFRRESLHFTSTPDNLNLDYSIVDRQTYTAAPWPATKMSGTHTETTGTAGVAPHYSEVAVRLEGPPNVDKIALIVRAFQIIDNRINFIQRLGDDSKNPVIVEAGSMVDYLGQPIVEATLRLQQRGDESTYFGNLKGAFASQIENLPGVAGEPEPYDPLKSQIPLIFGYCELARLFFIECYLQSPCNSRHGIAQVESPGSEDSDGEDGRTATLVYGGTAADLPEFNDLYSSGHRQHIYTHYKLDVQYTGQQNRVALPIARSSNSTDQDSFAVVRLAPTTVKRIVRVEAERAGEWPEVPKPEDYDDVDGIPAKLLKSEVFPASPILTADPSKTLFRIDMVAEYALLRAPPEGASLRVGRMPHMNVNLSATRVPPSAFVTDIDGD